MSNRHDQRKASATRRQSNLKNSTLDQHFDETLRRVRSEFELSGEVGSRFECLTNTDSFVIPAYWPDGNAKAAACAALRDSFRRRGVKRYLFASECWVGKTAGLRPAHDPARGESVQVIAVERNGLRRYAFAEITRNGATATLGPWQVIGDSEVPQSWLLELLAEGHSDRAAKAEPAPVGRLSRSDLQDLMHQHPEQARHHHDSFEIHSQLGDLIAGQMQKSAGGDAMAIFMAVESVLWSIVKEMGPPEVSGSLLVFSGTIRISSRCSPRYRMRCHPPSAYGLVRTPCSASAARSARLDMRRLHSSKLS